jgi:AcrR family transcriptional regulator
VDAVPKVSAEHLASREEQILHAAWRCFSRNGFHASSMNDVIAEAGMSAGAVYRYFRSKEELILAAADAAFAMAESVFEDLLADDAAPSPAEAVEHVLTRMVGFAERDGYDLTRIGLQAWGEALRNARLAEAAERIYRRLRDHFVEVVRRSQAAGRVPADADPDLAGQALFSLVPGFILQRLLIGDVDPASYARGVRMLFGE